MLRNKFVVLIYHSLDNYRSTVEMSLFIVKSQSGSKLNVLVQQKIDLVSFEEKNATLFFVVASLTFARNLIRKIGQSNVITF